ncbi:hypothetical protein HispidOSU_015478, partial [Sigmodon hispidus]
MVVTQAVDGDEEHSMGVEKEEQSAGTEYQPITEERMRNQSLQVEDAEGSTMDMLALSFEDHVVIQ